MTDEIDKLRAAMDAAAPAPTKKAETLARAMESFDAHQGSADRARPKPDRRQTRRLWQGVQNMLNTITTRGGIAATTALVAVGLVAVLPGDFPNIPGVYERQEEVVFGEPEPIEAEPMMDAEAFAAVPEATGGQTMGRALSGQLSQLSQHSRLIDNDVIILPEPSTEAFANQPPSALKITTEDPVATFSADIDTASYGIVRSSLKWGQMPPPEAVRIEEMVNYFPYAYPGPDGAHPFQPTVTVAQTPWNPGTRLLHIAVQGEMPEIDARPPLNLVFLIDTSGSMQGPAKLPLLKRSFAMMLGELRPDDQVAIVTYAGSAGQVLAPTPASERDTILDALDQLEAGGSTAGQAGLQQAYALAETMAEDGDVSRVILATDGDFNVGLSDPEALKTYIEDKRDSGTYLSVLGFGRGNLDDATMQALAQNGNGTASYIDTLAEARKVLVDQLTGALFPIADDLKFQVEFNPAQIAEYRLIGYETRTLNREDFNNDRVDAGDIGAGHSVTAIFEVAPVGSDAVLTDALRYGQAEVQSASGELGFLKIRYKRPGEDTSTLIETPILPSNAPLEGEAAFSAAIAGFGSLLRGVDYLGDWTYADAIALANANRGEDPFGYRSEAVTLMRMAQTFDR
ncbi:MAG: VWA domain-containing protein [Pseudomonadota bacterium]